MWGGPRGALGLTLPWVLFPVSRQSPHHHHSFRSSCPLSTLQGPGLFQTRERGKQPIHKSQFTWSS